METFDKQISDLKTGKETALRFFMDQYAQPLRFFAYKLIKDKPVATEIVSDAFVKLWERRLQFDSAEPLKSFLYVVVRNSCLDHLKHSRNKYSHDDQLLAELHSDDQDILTKMIYTELIALVVQEIEKLPRQQAHIFQLSVVEGKNTTEICDELGTTPSTVYFARSKAVATLKKVFSDKKISLYHFSALLSLQLDATIFFDNM
ncbi:RNA polymerase sigma-70 factor (ECF subfamily) [Sphingobacterium allocomposti]|uniref:RNA polymerase sigma-70 factor (ECF subfamily) n=1 Tax=Sphingobacterium allocomposti TaxID=415956 RepID=A0A5S5DR02_9SPHI|nr:RNA polymerase sigma-70 factor [Sphingobacterium composti Yoo et al. 2007 non Ten et al. 2007]TYP98393.1 RNA polymerase sigma-70 factor (ECF subfamily) [Sphingobacterium composti Yoo et al. 2007 non Ten et al. 2007]